MKKYKRRIFRGKDRCLWSMGYRTSARFRPFLLLLAFGLTTQSANEVKGCIVAAAQTTGNILADLNAKKTMALKYLKSLVKTTDDTLDPEVKTFMEVAAREIAEDGAGWGCHFFFSLV